jgi:hypothetical protein
LTGRAFLTSAQNPGDVIEVNKNEGRALINAGQAVLESTAEAPREAAARSHNPTRR